VYAIAARGSGGGEPAIDSAEELAELGAGYAGGVWTDKIDVMGPLVRGRREHAGR
jgi:hypothetical protein